MIKSSCSNKDCTVADTGICLEGHKDLAECPYFKTIKEQPETKSVDTLSQHVTPAEAKIPPIVRQFHSGNELGIDDASEIMRGQYVYLIGILGANNVGKTCFLSSLYLMASCGQLQPDYLFAGSLTLKGFEIRARRLRKWKGGTLPAKLADHTYIQDPNTPAFMHLILQNNITKRNKQHLLLTDLPGEWTTKLIDRADAANRFDFLRRADGIIYVIDGPLLASKKNHNKEIFGVKLFLKRLFFDVKVDKDIPLVLLISKCDELNMEEPKGVAEIRDEAIQLGFSPTVILAVSFSSKPDKIHSGTGVLNAIKLIVEYDWPDPMPSVSNNTISVSRAFGHFRLH